MRRGPLTALAFAIAIAIAPTPAGALFHIAHIDEVMTSYAGDPDAQFVEIRMDGPSQNFVTNSVIAAFDTAGAYVGDVLVVPGDVPNGGAGLRWIAATSAFEIASGLTADFTFAPGVLPTGGGMVCFGGGGGVLPLPPGSWNRNDFTNYIDCLAYGTYAGPSNLWTGTPTPLDGDGHSLMRVSTTFDNFTDFACADPATPENNAGATVALPA